MTSRLSGAFSLKELVAVIAILVIVIVVLAPMFLGRTHCGSRQMKDMTQVRGVQQAMVVWANQNQGDYPLPSKIDIANHTIDAPATSKDTTANIMSALLYFGSISTELLVSPAEVNPNISGYASSMIELENPKGAVHPDHALWDPAFSADFTSEKGGGTSYAHLQPAGGRRKFWADNFVDTVPIVGNRGPEVASVEYDSKSVPTCRFATPRSNTFLIHGGQSTWEGNIAYNDGHVAFETSPTPDLLSTSFRISVNGQRVRDVLFYDEPMNTNAYLGIFIRAGDTPADFQAIWD